DACGFAYFVVLTARGLDHWGRYDDRYTTASGGRWLFASRRVRLDGWTEGSWAGARRPWPRLGASRQAFFIGANERARVCALREFEQTPVWRSHTQEGLCGSGFWESSSRSRLASRSQEQHTRRSRAPASSRPAS